jgi:hypothetical protein
MRCLLLPVGLAALLAATGHAALPINVEPLETNSPPGSIVVPPPRGATPTAPPVARPANAPLPVTPQLVLSLVDGSKLRGTTTAKELTLKSEALGKLTVPLERIRQVKFSKDRESVTITLLNGDRIQAALGDTKLALTTLFGLVTVPLDKATEMQVQVGRGGPKPQGLVLWNTLGSRTEIEASQVGPAGICKGSDFCEGKFGQAVVVRPDQQRLVTFPSEGVNADAGCFEFWAKLTGMPRQLAWGQNPTLVRIVAGDQQYFLHLNGNDGNGRGGLCAQAGPIGGAGTGQFGNWTYERVLGADQVADWHHYALVWNKDGIAGIGDGKQRIAIFLDGQLHSSEAGNGDAATIPMKEGQVELLFNQHLRQGTIAFDNLKVWDHAKTEFNHRHEE